MSERTPLLYLNDILEAGISIQSYVSGIEYDQFAQDRMCYSAVIREFEIIGEAAGKLPDTIKRKISSYSLARHKRFSQPSLS